MLTLTDWQKEFSLPKNVIKTAIAISGIFDLTPLTNSWLQEDLKLSPKTVVNQSPQLLLENRTCSKLMPPLLLAVGENESSEFIRQSRDYLSQWKDSGYHGEVSLQKAKNHFDILHQLYDEHSELCQKIVSFIQKSR